MSQKSHRQIRHSKRVSSETGMAIAAMIGDPRPTKYKLARLEILAIIRRLPPSQRRTLMVDVVKELEEGADQDG